MISTTVLGILLFTVPFCIIALHSTKRYLEDRRSPEKKHLCYGFVCVSIGFILDLSGGLLAFPGMSGERLILVNTLIKLFDAFNLIGVFWFFVFLTDFAKKIKKFIVFVLLHLIITS